MSGALPNQSTTSVLRQHSKHVGDRSKKVTSPTRAPLRMPREIQPQHQNWLARFLRIKPAVTSFCFQASRIRARKEITAIFREWRKYGMKDVVIDKGAGRIWARVAVKNCKGAPDCDDVSIPYIIIIFFPPHFFSLLFTSFEYLGICTDQSNHVFHHFNSSPNQTGFDRCRIVHRASSRPQSQPQHCAVHARERSQVEFRASGCCPREGSVRARAFGLG